MSARSLSMSNECPINELAVMMLVLGSNPPLITRALHEGGQEGTLVISLAPCL